MQAALEGELQHRLWPRNGCWPLVVGVAGILLALVLLAGLA